MKHYAAAIAGALLCISAHAQTTIATPPTASSAAVEVFFSPGSTVDQALAAAILSARKRVWLAGYAHFDADRESLARGQRAQDRRAGGAGPVTGDGQVFGLHLLLQPGCAASHQRRYPIMHHKFLVIDDDMVGFGSMNFTKAGTKDNAQNFNLFRRWPKLAETYAKEFRRLERESDKYEPDAAAGAEGKTEWREDGSCRRTSLLG